MCVCACACVCRGEFTKVRGQPRVNILAFYLFEIACLPVCLSAWPPHPPNRVWVCGCVTSACLFVCLPTHPPIRLSGLSVCHCCECQAGWPASFQGFCLCFLSCGRNNKIRDTCYSALFEFQGFELWSLHLCCEHFVHQRLSSVPL